MTARPDKELMFEVRDGNLDQLSVLFQRHHKALYGFLLRMTGNTQTSEDLVQEVFLRILKYRHTYRGDSQFVVWMFRIARNARVDYYRKKHMDSLEKKDASTILSDDLNPLEDYEKTQDSAILHRALAQLTEDDREVLLLSRFENMKYKDIADLLGCLEGTIKARVHRAIARLRDTFFELSGEVT